MLNRYIDGWADPALEPMAAGTAGEADTLARFVARNFVVAELRVREPLCHIVLIPCAVSWKITATISWRL